MSLADIDLNNLDLSDIGNWPTAAKAAVLMLLVAIVITVGYFLDTSDQLKKLESIEQKETELRQLFEFKQAKAANLDSYKEQLKEIERTFGSLLNQLPSRNEVADLLTDISQTGLSNGLDFDLFKPAPESPKEFYAELPINLKVRGEYHQFGKFISGVASLPRIVTLHDFKIKAAPKKQARQQQNKKKKKKDLLTLEAQAKTYRYLDEKELEKLSGKK